MTPTAAEPQQLPTTEVIVVPRHLQLSPDSSAMSASVRFRIDRSTTRRVGDTADTPSARRDVPFVLARLCGVHHRRQNLPATAKVAATSTCRRLVPSAYAG
jgi:hypothetical protein